MNRKARVEIAGLPGVGKTTLIRRLLESGSLSGYRVVESRAPSLLNKIVAKAFFLLWLRWVIEDKAFARALAYRLSFRALFFERKPVLYFDSGLIQLFLEHFIARGQDSITQDVVRLCLLLPMPSRLLYLTDDIESILARELYRDARRFGSMDRDSLSERYQGAENLLKSLVFSRTPDIRILNIGNREEVERALLS